MEWCGGIDEGPYSSVSAGERITFHNPELLVTSTPRPPPSPSGSR